MTYRRPQRGFTLLIAVILASVTLSLGLALLDIAYKQIVLATSAKQSQYGFYNADTGLECALYFDQQQNAFDYTSPATSITCAAQTMTFATAPNSTSVVGSVRTTKLYLTCPSSGYSAILTVTKDSAGSTTVYSTGYNNCSASDAHRVERGLKASY